MSHKNMVFTSAGDNTRFVEYWCSRDKQNYDIYVLYYVNNDTNFQLYESNVTFIEKSKGSKFQNFHKFWNAHPEIIDKYDRFFILDDDIEITCDGINEMFETSKKYNLKICAPSFTNNSQVTYDITKNKDNILLSYTNFVEVNTPLFTKNALKLLMNVYDPILIGWGIDYLYIWANDLHNKNSYAIVHKIQCRNPPTDTKKNKSREILLVKDAEIREKIWRKYADSIKCPVYFKPLQYLSIPLLE